MLWQRDGPKVGGQCPAAGDSGLEHRDPSFDDDARELLDLSGRGSVPLGIVELR
jgi:hypothetical protein